MSSSCSFTRQRKPQRVPRQPRQHQHAPWRPRPQPIKTGRTVKYPTDSHRTAAINAQALPVYEKSAVSAQSAHFSNISGATETWHGFQASFKQAISQAG